MNMRMVRQTAALICCHAIAPYGVIITPAMAKEIALDVHVDITAPLGHQCVNTEMLNVRAGPGADYERLYQIPEGQQVEVWGRLDDWCFVMWDGGEGWVSADYLGDSRAFHEALRVDISLVSRIKGWLTR